MNNGNLDLIKRFLNKKNIFAVVGASKLKEKFGNQVYFDLKNSGYKVYPINPNANTIFGDKCYPNLKKLPIIPDVVNIVVPPKITEKTVEECNDLKIKKVWMQPGSESEKAIDFCKKNGIEILFNVCVMLERKNIDYFLLI
jgi:predicted CoA-binding protein